MVGPRISVFVDRYRVKSDSVEDWGSYKAKCGCLQVMVYSQLLLTSFLRPQKAWR